MLEAHNRGAANLVVGSRFIDNAGFRSTRLRRLGIRLIAFALNKLFAGGHVTDPTSGMRLLDRRAIAFFAQRYPMDFPEPISLAWAMRAGLTVGEAPVAMRARETGVSSIDGFKSVSYMIRVLGYILLARLARASDAECPRSELWSHHLVEHSEEAAVTGALQARRRLSSYRALR